MVNLLFVMLTFQLAASSGLNYETVRLSRRLTAVKTSEKITLDGRLNEAAWANAPLAKDFIQNEPREGQPSAELSEAPTSASTSFIVRSATCFSFTTNAGTPLQAIWPTAQLYRS